LTERLVEIYKKEVFNDLYLPYLHAPQHWQIFYGGSLAGKSVFIAQRCVVDLLEGGRNYLVLRNVARTSRQSTFAEIKRVMSTWGVDDLFESNKSDLTITCRNGYQAIFAGLDDVEKLKSITPAKDVLTDVWVEEATETSRDAIFHLEQLLRGKSKKPKRITLSFNPIVSTHWIVQEFFNDVPYDQKVFQSDNKLIVKSTYQDNVRFLTQQDIDTLENTSDEYFYQVYTLGNWGTLGDNVPQIQAERCRRDFYYFLQTFWPEVSNDDFRPNWHIELLCKELMTLARRVARGEPKEYDLVINVPPGTTKTIICSIMFPAWCWINWFWMRFITASYSGALSLESAEYSRDLVKSAKFQLFFPDLAIKQDKDTKSNFRIQKQRFGSAPKLGGNRYSTSVGGTLTGFHGHIIIVDDPLDPNRAFSETELANANRWMEHTLLTRKVDKAVTPVVLIMQRLHQDDPTGHLLAKQKVNVRHICLPGEIRSYEDEVRPPELKKHYSDGLLDPNRMPWPVLKDMKHDLGQYAYAAQIGQRPTPPGGGMFRVENFHVIDRLPPEGLLGNCVRYWDKACTEAGGAYTVGVKMYEQKDQKKWIVADVVRGQWATDERERIIRRTAEADGRAVTIHLEQEPGSGGKDSLHASITNLAGFAAYGDRPTGDKAFRADPYSVQVNEGNILLLHGDWNTAFKEEHEFFPYGTYKDQVDAAAAAYTILTRHKRAGVLGRRTR
jgi:predicted phage terminase large subunit-like protein